MLTLRRVQEKDEVVFLVRSLTILTGFLPLSVPFADIMRLLKVKKRRARNGLIIIQYHERACWSSEPNHHYGTAFRRMRTISSSPICIKDFIAVKGTLPTSE